MHSSFQICDELLHETASDLEVTTYYLNSILRHMSQGLLFINLKGFVTTYNKAAEQLLERSRKEVLYNPFSAHFEDSLFGFSIKKAIEEQQVPTKTVTSLSFPSGTQKEVEIETTLILVPGAQSRDELQGIILLLRDVTEWNRLQLTAQRKDRMQALGEMAGLVAHEIRNPLGSIKGFASLLVRDLAEHPALQRMAKDILTGTDNLNRLVTNVLNYSRPLQTHFVESDLIAFVRDLCRQVEADENLGNKISLEFHSTLSELKTNFDPVLLKSALLNLVANSIQAMPEGGKLSLEVAKRAKHVVIKIQDSGVGIPSENLSKLFLPFFTTKASGNGFGLMEVQRVIQAHSGSIEVHSEVNKGTTFTLLL